MLVNKLLVVAYFGDACTSASCAQDRVVLQLLNDSFIILIVPVFITAAWIRRDPSHFATYLIVTTDFTSVFKYGTVRSSELQLSASGAFALAEAIIVAGTSDKGLKRCVLTLLSP